IELTNATDPAGLTTVCPEKPPSPISSFANPFLFNDALIGLIDKAIGQTGRFRGPRLIKHVLPLRNIPARIFLIDMYIIFFLKQLHYREYRYRHFTGMRLCVFRSHRLLRPKCSVYRLAQALIPPLSFMNSFSGVRSLN